MGIIVLSIFIFCGFYVQMRGQVAHEKLTRRLTDHSNLFGPINCLFYGFSAVEKSPYIDVKQFPELQILQEQWETIRDEAIQLNNENEIKASDKLDDIGFNSFFKTGWKRFYLKWYGSDLKSAMRLCPKTFELLSSIDSVKGAMFASLPPGARLVKHRDPYAGSLRYHLGLLTPNDNDCFIDVDGEKYSWRDGEAVMFDETFIHYAENKTDKERIVLFLDIKRPVRLKIIDWFNTLFSNLIMSGSATKNMEGDKVGFLNKAFGGIYKIREVGKKIKAFNVPLYYTLQYSIYLLLIYWLFF